MGISSTQRERLRVSPKLWQVFLCAIRQVRTGLETKVQVLWCCSADVCSLPTGTQSDCDEHRGLGLQVFLWESTWCIPAAGTCLGRQCMGGKNHELDHLCYFVFDSHKWWIPEGASCLSFVTIHPWVSLREPALNSISMEVRDSMGQGRHRGKMYKEFSYFVLKREQIYMRNPEFCEKKASIRHLLYS